MELQNKSVVITGAASGIGAATALHMSALGAKVAASDIDSEGVEDIVSKIKKSGGTAFAQQVDVTDFEQVTEWMARAKEMAVSISWFAMRGSAGRNNTKRLSTHTKTGTM